MVNGICFKFSILPVGIQMGKKNETTKFCEYIYIYIYIYIYEWLAYIIAMYVFWKVVFEKLLFKLLCICLLLEKLVTENTFQSKKNLIWFPEKCFP